VAQPVRVAAIDSVSPNPLPFIFRALCAARLVSHRESVSFCGVALGVGHPEETLPLVRRPNARSRETRSPDAITKSLQISRYSGEPKQSSAALNLFAKQALRSALFDQPSNNGPEVPFVAHCRKATCAGEGLAGEAGRPDWLVVGPPGKLESVLPAADSREEVDAGVSHQVSWCEGGDGSPVDGGGGEEIAEPSGAERVVVVEVHDTRRP
jgi:hypothetical protein